MIQLQEITKEYSSNGSGEKLVVLDSITCSIEKGEAVSIVGPSGSGKSTLLNLIGALDKPTSGTVRVDDVSLAHLDDNDLARVRNQKIGFVFQLHHLLPQCSVLENVLIPTLINPSSENQEQLQSRARSLLEKVGLAETMHRLPGRISGGQRQRVSLVRALINEPVVLLADEPTGSLDRKSAETISELLIELNQTEGLTLIVATHDLHLAGKMSRMLRLEEGKLHQEGHSDATD